MSIMMPTLAPGWLSFHLYYHGDLGLAVREFVAPVVSTSLGHGWVDRFFFLRYSLGGPHVRLRLRTLPEHGTTVAEATRQASDLFLSRTPSTRSLDEELIRSQNRSILEADAHETDVSVYPDNTLLAFPFRPEVDRYGGPDVLALSLDVFTASSIEALHFLENHHAEPVSRRLVLALRILLRQALYFAVDEEELSSLLGYAVASWGDSCQAILEKGLQVFARQRAVFEEILQREVAALPPGAQAGGLTLRASVRRLSRALAGREQAVRWRIGGSHLHTTANRLGLSTAEEVYASQLLTAAARHLLSPESLLRHDLQEALASRKDIELPDDLTLPPVEFGAPPP